MNHSQELMQQAEKLIPGGVNSPVRAFRGVGGTPVFMQRGEGAYLIDVDGKRYVDYIGSWGPLILGHAHPAVVETLENTLRNGTSFGAPTPLEIQMATKVCELMPNIEMLRMVNSGTETALSVIRLARGYTGRNKIIKFNGCYHGHCDALLVKAGSGNLTCGVPDSAGIPDAVTADTLVAEYNDLAHVRRLFQEHGKDIAAIIVEPIAGNMNFVMPSDEFLPGLRALCDEYDSLLIFDEVMTGFRVALGGAQALFNIKPDLTMLGKVIGGGLPVGAFGGRRDIMQKLAPHGPVYQAGTLSGNPLALAAGLKTLELISQPDFFNQLSHRTKTLVDSIVTMASDHRIEMLGLSQGGMFGLFFTNAKQITTLNDVMQCDKTRYQLFFHAMLNAGVYLAPSAFEVGFVSSAHQQNEIDLTLAACKKAFAAC